MLEQLRRYALLHANHVIATGSLVSPHSKSSARADPQPDMADVPCDVDRSDNGQEGELRVGGTRDEVWKGQLPHLKHRRQLQVVSTTTGKVIWSHMKCAYRRSNGGECCVQLKKRNFIRKILCHDNIMLLEVPQLFCTVHNTSFVLTADSSSWAEVEGMQDRGEVMIQPQIVVLSPTVVLTMKAYR
jgi:hypothetical protein